MHSPRRPPAALPPEVLLIDDDLEMARMVVELLQREGLRARHAESGHEGLAALQAREPDVLLLDVMLPDANGLDLCRRLRTTGSDLPILMLTARGDPIDRVLGLEIGADDYLGKPFEPRELVARVRALARRHRAPAQDGGAATELRFGALHIDRLARRVEHAGTQVTLSNLEFKLLAALVAQPGSVLSREALSAAVQPGHYTPLDRAVDVQVARLRRKLREAGAGADCIETLRSEGYRFNPQAG